MLAEYTALRNEIAYRSTAQLAIVTFHITAVGGVTSFALANISRAYVLLLLPYSSWALARLFIDHARAIHGIARYTEEELWRRIRELSVPIPSWEQHLHNQERDREDDAKLSLPRYAWVLRAAHFVRLSDKQIDWLLRRLRRYSYAFSLCAIFMAPPVVIFIAALNPGTPQLTTTLSWIAWAVGIVLVVTMIPSWVWFFHHPMQPGEDDKPDVKRS